MHKSDWDGDIIPPQNAVVPVELNPSQLETIEQVKQWMKRNAYEPSTTKYVAKRTKYLMRYTDFDNPEQVKEHIANKQCSNAYKESLIETYAIYMRMMKREWNQPFYERYDKKRRAPKEELVDFLINHARIELRLKLSISKDL